MAATTNPFPGMNPFLERNWAPVHTALIGFIWDEIARQLPPDLICRPEERILIDEVPASSRYRADVAVSQQESWKSGVAPAWTPEASDGNLVVAEPERVWIEETVERWIEIRTIDGVLVTALEVLSPSNKTGAGLEAYLAKRKQYTGSLASLVEIDLLRDGRPVLAGAQSGGPGTCYHICVRRPWQPHIAEVYRCPLRERLPAFRVPLRESDTDIVLDLQPLVDRVYGTGRYYLSPHDREPYPPFEGEEAAWVDERLRAAGLR